MPRAAAVLLATFTLLAAAAPGVAAPAPAEASSPLREALVAELAAHGVDPAVLLAMPVEMSWTFADGSTATTVTTLDALLARAEGADVVPSGGPAVTVGDVWHMYVNVGFGSALAYRATQSTLVPSTPAIVLPAPATALFFDAGGPMRNVRASYLAGVHTVGTVVGSNVDTSAGGPYVPLLTGGAVLDSRMDLVGHASFGQAEACLFGLCAAFGFLLGTGAAGWNGSAPAFPQVP